MERLGYETETQFPICDGPDEPPFAYTDLRIKGSRAVIEYDGEVKYETGTAAPLLAERSDVLAHPDQIAWIANHAEDQILCFDLTFLPLVQALHARCATVGKWVALCDADRLPADSGIPGW